MADKTCDNALLDFLNCEKIDDDYYRGQSQDFGTGQVYGGQVLGQAIKAAQNTVDVSRSIHSAHAYFLLRGDVNEPILYGVDRSRDGSSFSSRRVVAIQNGQQIFHLSASFQIDEPGLEFYQEPELPIDILSAALSGANIKNNQFQSKYLDAYILSPEEKTAPNAFQMWVKAKHQLPEGQGAHSSVLAYISDMGLLLSAFVPHELGKGRIRHNLPNMVVASLDHAIWFHRPFRADDWFFYDCRAESTSNSRAFSHGRVYSRDGMLVASTSQEGLLRRKSEP